MEEWNIYLAQDGDEWLFLEHGYKRWASSIFKKLFFN
jgi:hypothetical protein